MNKELYGMETDDVNLSSDDEDSSDNENEALEEQAEEIEKQLSSNVYLYDLHKELINICEKTGDLNSLRLAFERFANTFPLTEDLWLKWIKIEISVAEDDKKNILGIFDRATKDYLSVKLWLEYVQYAMSHSELKETHEILEIALSVAGLHYTDASLLWDILRELEFAHLSITAKESEDYQIQLHRLVDAYKRQLSVPLLNINDTYTEWQQFIEQMPEIDATIVEQGYKKAVECIESYKPYEERLLMAKEDQEFYDIYTQYIKSIKNPSLILCLYERAVEKLCLMPQIWVDYINFTLKLGDVSLKVSERALRNVTWYEELWCLRLKILEKYEQPAEKVLLCFEEGLKNITGGGLDLWLDYIAFTKRNLPDQLLKLLDQAEDQEIIDPTFKLTRYHALVCAKLGNMERSRELWNNLMLDSQAKSSCQFWLEFIRIERQFGTVSTARNILNRAMTCNTDWPQTIADEWLMFERDEGTLEDMLKCQDKIIRILPQKLKVLEQQTVVALTTPNDGDKRNSTKRKLESDNKDDAAHHKKHKEEYKKPLPKNQGPPSDLDPTKSVFISNLSPTVTRQQLTGFFSNGKVTLATNNKGQSRCFGYVQFQTPEEAQNALSRDRTHFESRPIFISKCKTDPGERQASFKFSQNVEDNKLFVRGLPIKYTQEDVEKLFMSFKCTDVRLVMHKSGQSKGLAYVEFGNEKDALNAMKATDNMTIENFIISVAISAPPPKAAKKDRLEPQRHARSRLQVPLIPRAAMKQQMQEQNESNGASSTNLPKSNNDFRNMLMSNTK